jgi:hypothetical protein
MLSIRVICILLLALLPSLSYQKVKTVLPREILESPYQKVKTVLLLGQKNTYPTYV